jgi:epoxide hydrolase A/B
VAEPKAPIAGAADVPGVSHEMVPTNGIEMHVALAGPADGPPVVLCHGFPELWYSWRALLPALAGAGYRAIAPDLRGYGASSHPTEVRDYGADNLTADLYGLLDHYGYAQAAFSGHDWGANVVWELGRLHPERVSSIYNMSVPYSASPGPPTDVFKHLWGDKFFYILYFQAVGPAEAEFDADRRRWVRTMMYSSGGEGMANPSPRELDSPATGTKLLDIMTPPPAQLPAWLTEHDVDVYVEGLSGGLFGPLSYYRNLDANWQRSKDIPASVYTMPVGFITGSLDPVYIIMPGGIDTMAAALPNFRGTTVVDGAGHWVQQERPTETAKAMLAFLDSVTTKT